MSVWKVNASSVTTTDSGWEGRRSRRWRSGRAPKAPRRCEGHLMNRRPAPKSLPVWGFSFTSTFSAHSKCRRYDLASAGQHGGTTSRERPCLRPFLRCSAWPRPSLRKRCRFLRSVKRPYRRLRSPQAAAASASIADRGAVAGQTVATTGIVHMPMGIVRTLTATDMDTTAAGAGGAAGCASALEAGERPASISAAGRIQHEGGRPEGRPAPVRDRSDDGEDRRRRKASLTFLRSALQQHCDPLDEIVLRDRLAFPLDGKAFAEIIVRLARPAITKLSCALN
jgi:hypothetical protein